MPTTQHRHEFFLPGDKVTPVSRGAKMNALPQWATSRVATVVDIVPNPDPHSGRNGLLVETDWTPPGTSKKYWRYGKSGGILVSPVYLALCDDSGNIIEAFFNGTTGH